MTMRICVYSYVESCGDGRVSIRHFSTKALRDAYRDAAQNDPGCEDPSCSDSVLELSISSEDGEILSDPECTILNPIYGNAR